RKKKVTANSRCERENSKIEPGASVRPLVHGGIGHTTAVRDGDGDIGRSVGVGTPAARDAVISSGGDDGGEADGFLTASFATVVDITGPVEAGSRGGGRPVAGGDDAGCVLGIDDDAVGRGVQGEHLPVGPEQGGKFLV